MGASRGPRSLFGNIRYTPRRGAVLVWLVLAFMVGKEYKRLVASGESPS